MPLQLQLNEEDYKTILQNRFNNDAVKFVSYKTRSLPSMSGVMGDHGLLDLTYELNGVMSTETFFVKVSPQTSVERERTAKERNVYAKEIFFYEYLLKEYKNIGIDTSFAPACYLCKGNNTLVMENLVDKGFQVPTGGTFNLEELKVCLTALAKFHGASMVYEAKKAKQLGRPYQLDNEFPDEFKENVLVFDDPTHFIARIMKTTLQLLVDLAEDVPQISTLSEFKTRILQMDWRKIIWEESKFQKASLHSDLWRNNIFISYEEKVARKACLVDFQTYRYFYPSLDVLVFLYLNTNEQFRGKYEKDLLKYYYDALAAVFEKHDYSIADLLSPEEYYESLHHVELLARINTFYISIITRLPTEGLAEMLKFEEETWKNTDIFEELVKKFYQKDEEFRKTLQECIVEINNTMYGGRKYSLACL